MVTIDPLTIKNHVIAYFQDLFTTLESISTNYQNVEDIVPTLVSIEENTMLTAIPNPYKIKLVVFSLDPSSSLGLDGFSGFFFQTCWDIVHVKVTAAVQHFFCTGHITPGLNSNFMVLIPKVPDASKIE